MKAIRLAFVGCGAFARRYHVPALVENPDVLVTAVCDPSAAPELIETASWLEAPLVREIDDLWKLDPDAVIVSTPHALHAAHVHAALQHGKHVLVDKPFVLVDSDAVELSELAVRTGIVNAVSFNRRFDRACLRARDIVQGGEIGRVCHVETVQLGYEREGWFLVPELGGGGPFTGRASHVADLIPWLTRQAPCSVRARLRAGPPGRSDYGGFIDVRFGSFDCRMTCIEAGLHMWDEIRIYGETGLIELRRPLTLPIGWTLAWTKNRSGDMETMTADPVPGEATLDFIKAIRTGCAPACSFADARTSVRIVESAFASARQAQCWIDL